MALTYPLLPSTFVSAFPAIHDGNLVWIVSHAIGASEPAQSWPGMLWADTNEGWLKQKKSDDSAWRKVSKLDEDYGGLVPLTGAVMTGPLDMNGNGITGLPVGSGSAPARADELLALMPLNATRIFTALPKGPAATNPTHADHLTPKQYVDAQTKTGGTFTGAILVPFAPTNDNHVVRLIDLVGAIQNHGHTGGTDGALVFVEDAVETDVADAIGDGVMANGAGRALVRPRANHVEAPVVLYDGSSNSADQAYNVQASVTQVAQAAILKMRFTSYCDLTSVANFMEVLLRKDNVSTQVPYRCSFQVDNASGAPFGTVVQDVTAFVALTPTQTFRMQIVKNGNTNMNVKVELIGRI